MTHRPIAPIEINGFEPGGTPSAIPIFELVKPETLLIDEGYQRDSSERSLRLVRKIVAGWSWSRFKPPVAVLTDAGLELIDGQHTAIAAATHPDIVEIPVMIIEAPERADRAGAFISHNRDRVAVTVPQLHVAALAAGDADAQAVQRVCAEAGVTVLRTQPGAGRYQPATTVSVMAIASLIRGRGEIVAVKVMSVLARAGLAPINQTHIRAVDLLLNTNEYSTQLTPESLVTSIQAMTLKIDSEAAVFRAAHPSTPAWKAVAIIWFRNRRGSKAPSSVPVPSGSGRDAAVRAKNAQAGSLRGALKTEDSSEAGIPTTDLKTASGKLIENIEHKPVNPIAVKRQAPPVSDSGKRDARPKLNGWMPGVFLLRCSSCDEKYQGDRKSRSCGDCAYGCREAVSA